MEIRELRVYAAVCASGSISAAARELHASQSSVSDTVRSLERQLGRSLLHRSRNGVVPTETGLRLRDGAEALVNAHDRMLNELREPAAEAGTLRIGLPLEFSTGLLTAASGEMARRHQGLRLELRPQSTAGQWRELRRGELDVALLRDRPDDDAFDSMLIAEEPLGVVVTDDAPLDQAGPISLADLAGQRWVGFPRDETPTWFDQVAAVMHSHGIGVEERPAGVGPLTWEVKLAAVADGRSFTLAPATWRHPLPAGLVWRPLVDEPVVRRTWAAWAAASTRREIATLLEVLGADVRAP